MSNASSAIQGFQDAEISKVTRKYDKEIKAAKKQVKILLNLKKRKKKLLVR